MSKFSKQEHEWMDRSDESTNPQERLELSKNLKMRFTPENAQTIADAHARIIARRTAQTKGEPKEKSPSKGISQEAINTLLDLSITTEEALDKSAEITIREAEQERPTWDDFFSVESREEKIAILDKMFGGSLTQEEVERFLAIE